MAARNMKGVWTARTLRANQLYQIGLQAYTSSAGLGRLRAVSVAPSEPDEVSILKPCPANSGTTILINQAKDNMTSIGTVESGREYDNAIVRFFNKWPEFDYHREAEVIKEFRRLCREKQWRPEERQIVKSDLRDAMVQRFNEIYGTNEKDLEAWQRLCRDTHVKSIPDTLAECEEDIDETFVNLVDLVDEGEVKRFDTLEDLVEYTKETEKYFPRKSAYAGGLLRKLLREIEDEYLGKKHRGSTSGRGRGRGRGGKSRGGRGDRNRGGGTL